MIDRYLLFPYYWTLRLRNHLYDKGILKSRRADAPTICVGNITVGGTGKTPHTEMILKELLSSPRWCGRNIAVLSRGYGRDGKGFRQVSAKGSAADFGDEPLQIKKNFPNVTVAVDRDRLEGCRLLGPAADIIVLDDAFQYRKLKASLNIVLVDYNRPLHKDHLLPLGRLRDLPERISEADVIIVTKCPPQLSDSEKTSIARALGITDFRAATSSGTGMNGRLQSVLFTFIRYRQPRTLFPDGDERHIHSEQMILFTGIARDKALREHLGKTYRIVQRFSFPDHHRYKRSDFRKIQKAAAEFPDAAIATTQKDAQRVLDYNGLPENLRKRMLVIPIYVEFLSEGEAQIFRKIINNI